MKNVCLSAVCCLTMLACGDNRPANDPSTGVTTTTTTESTPTTHANNTSATTPSVGAQSQPSTMSPTMSDAPSAYNANNPGNTASGSNTAISPSAAPANASGTADATNTKINERDRHDTMTPGNQGNGKSDTDITAEIRRSVVADSALSFNAKNVKIITKDGKVTLRGPVKSDTEKSSIESKAKAAAGVSSVDNQLEVKK